MAEPPYGVISDLLRQGQVVPLLGAGVNFGTRPHGATYREKDPEFLPSGAELSHVLARDCSFPSTDGNDLSDLAKVASYFEETTGRKVLRGWLRQVFHRDYQPCAIHTYLAEIDKPLLIVTTNYDDLMERALDEAGRPYDLVVYPTDRKDVEGSILWRPHGADQPEAVTHNKFHIDLERTTVVYKMHGTVDRSPIAGDSYVITEDDYVDFLSRMTRQGQGAVPAIFIKHFRTRHFLFMGYGLRDWNLRVVLKNLKRPTPASAGGSRDEDMVSWAIQYGPSALERELWQSRKVKIYDVEINQFVKRLKEEGA